MERIEIVLKNIKKIRKFKNITQLDIAIKLNISQNAYSKVELGNTLISLNLLFKIADILGQDINELLLTDKIIKQKNW
ncbi:DNA-binding transcriptional regulator, XRE-family HTH domain [Mucilaginibacter mallensis]|uniref:DNA-binding transcriptional regulator, XRE-family HTH domain n=1 Tax=Mucilaginibacter mallensis TaxID=652787 RepID=A0A1H2B0R0_MUCMA|nr:helix-turn-helix transcriptional regulator [Mucilaginibacter mallensis]SDT51617.1 DNA-binding transcriptional regulator, XRE-family HTH domain [Mucilaginibacter mallensis]